MIRTYLVDVNGTIWVYSQMKGEVKSSWTKWGWVGTISKPVEFFSVEDAQAYWEDHKFRPEPGGHSLHTILDAYLIDTVTGDMFPLTRFATA